MNVSIIIPMYNVEAYIAECLESVARQTYNGEMECIIIDDCSKDDSAIVAENFINEYQGSIQFKMLHHDINRGQAAARNLGVKSSTGDFIYFLDSDDMILPDAIEGMMRVVESYPQVELVQGGMVSMDGHVMYDFSSTTIPSYTDKIKWIVGRFELPVSPCNRLIKRDFLLKAKVIFHEGIIFEDVPYCFLLSLKCKNVGFVKTNSYLCRQNRENSTTYSPDESRALKSRLILLDDCIEAFTHNQVTISSDNIFPLTFIWVRWFRYMNKHSYESISNFASEISVLAKKIIKITPYPQKFWAIMYHILPLTLRGKSMIVNVFAKHIVFNL